MEAANAALRNAAQIASPFLGPKQGFVLLRMPCSCSCFSPSQRKGLKHRTEAAAVVAQRDQQSSVLTPPLARVVEESLELLEWPALCSQVAAFASTSLAARHITHQGLALGNAEVSLTTRLPSL